MTIVSQKKDHCAIFSDRQSIGISGKKILSYPNKMGEDGIVIGEYATDKRAREVFNEILLVAVIDRKKRFELPEA